jgi:hypothetical protein
MTLRCPWYISEQSSEGCAEINDQAKLVTTEPCPGYRLLDFVVSTSTKQRMIDVEVFGLRVSIKSESLLRPYQFPLEAEAHAILL